MINRFLGFISAFDDTCNGVKRLNKLTVDVKEKERTYLYYLTEFGKQVIVTCLKLKNMFLVPELSHG
ncbi:MAG: hypothetical protein LBF80_01375 [Spirochaetaceae bacterium]|nr:hypothetical protein [Spirochaetaceae bacterium]